jgi:glycosyltransferase involved in cell wall biosynthesis
MRSATVLVPGSLDALTGGSIYDRRIVEGLRSQGWAITVRELDSSFPEPSAPALGDAAAVLAALPDDEVVIVDGLAFGAMPDVLEVHAARLKLVALVHMPLSLEYGLDELAICRRRSDEARALHFARAVVATGQSTLLALAGMGQTGPRIALVEPGCDPAPLARGAGGGALRLLCVAAAVPGKGHAGLLRALATIRGNWTLTCVGSLSRDRATADGLVRLVKMLSLEERVAFVGELDDRPLAAAYDAADVFVLNTLRETFGMAVSEAIARGLPVVSTRTGAIPETVGHGGVLIEPGDGPALATALSEAVTDADARRRWRNGAIDARARLGTWSAAVSKMVDVMARVSTRG